VSERRRRARSGINLRALQHLGSRQLERCLSQVGAGGFFVEDPGGAARPGELVVMELADGDQGGLRVTGEIVHVSERGFGVRITRADWDRLRALLAREERRTGGTDDG
jgi:hypothetical protein